MRMRGLTSQSETPSANLTYITLGNKCNEIKIFSFVAYI